MEILPYIVTTAVALAFVLWAEVTKRPLINTIFKPIASLGFVLGAVAVGALDHPLGAPLLVALCLSMLGDVLLISKEKRVFMAGIGAFLAAHLAYGWMFLVMGVEPVWLAAALVLAALTALVIWRWLAAHVNGAMRVAVMAYIAVITLMVALAFGAGALAGVLPIAAAVTFWLSDLTVARHRFVKPEAINRLVGLPLYYGAQYLFIALIH
jgi:uncharacterized membrane protein YhhN